MRFYASNIYHDPSLVTDISYLTGISVYDAYGNTLNIEASGSNINFYTNDNYKTYFYGDVCVDKDLSLNSKLDVSGVVSALRFVGDGSELTGVGQLVLKQVLDASLGFVEISNLMVNIDTSLNAHVDISENLFVGGHVSINKNLKIDGIFTDGNYTFDTNGNVTGLGTVGCGAITSTGDLAVTGTITGNTSITLDNITITIGELEY